MRRAAHCAIRRSGPRCFSGTAGAPPPQQPPAPREDVPEGVAGAAAETAAVEWDSSGRPPPEIRERLQQASGVTLGGAPLPPPVTYGSADEWQPPRLRDRPPYLTRKWKYRGGYKLIWDAFKWPIACALFTLFTIQFRNWWYDWKYGPPDFSTLDQYHDWDEKRPKWPPIKPYERDQGKTLGMQHEVW
eukprot:TRINITY_DN8393_c1_g1_i1.p2 TRINITY_DN8393_c1_g1~~TRINITY_DN8393_c1_g1_i1.p2  ORF type:complete len:188 (+),score=66.29 TRINITY_DN8393_c1_g1_i1:87-650(+)